MIRTALDRHLDAQGKLAPVYTAMRDSLGSAEPRPDQEINRLNPHLDAQEKLAPVYTAMRDSLGSGEPRPDHEINRRDSVIPTEVRLVVPCRGIHPVPRCARKACARVHGHARQPGRAGTRPDHEINRLNPHLDAQGKRAPVYTAMRDSLGSAEPRPDQEINRLNPHLDAQEKLAPVVHGHARQPGLGGTTRGS